MRYDEPGFVSRTPAGDFQSHDSAMTAPGGSGPRTPPPDQQVPAGMSGLPGVGTVSPLGSQAGPGESASTSQPGQTADSPILIGPADQYVNTGATGSDARTDHFTREPYQQPRGD